MQQLQDTFLLAAVFFVLGDFIAVSFALDYTVLYMLLAVAATSIILVKKHTITIIACALFLALGYYLGAGHNIETISRQAQHFVDKDVRLIGKVRAGSSKETDKYKELTLDVLSIDDTKPQRNWRVRVYYRGNAAHSGDIVAVSGLLRENNSFHNPLDEKKSRQYYLQGYLGRMFTKEKLQVLQRNTTIQILDIVHSLNNDIRKKLQAFLPDTDAALIYALLFGGSQGLDPEIVESFSVTGIIHILSVSGSHTTLVAAGIFALCSWLLPRKIAVVFSIMAIMFYALLCSLVVPVVRAAIMTSAVLLGLCVGRKADMRTLFALTVLVMLSFDPSLVAQLSFQLSFLATGSLIFVRPQLVYVLKPYIKNFYIQQFIAASLAVQIVLFPILVDTFGRFSLLVFISNLIVLPFIEFAIVIAVLGSILLYVFLPLGKVLLILTSLLLDCVVMLNAQLATFKGLVVIKSRLTPLTVCIYYLAWQVLLRQSEDGRTSCKLAAAGVVTALVVYVFSWNNYDARVHFIDVGQGDCALVTTPEGYNILIDTGGVSERFDVGRNIILPYLRQLGINKLDLLVLSHGDFDHSGGSKSILADIPVTQILLPNVGIHENLLNILENSGAKISYAKGDEVLSFGSCKLQVVHAPQHFGIGNDSLVVSIQQKGYKALFTGDLPSELESPLLSKVGKIDILKVAHHGSATSSGRVFIQKLAPQLAVISVGKYNRFRHPTAEVLDNLHQAGAKVLRTDLHGAIAVELREDAMAINTTMRGE